MASLSPDQLDELQAFLKDWLRHTGRTQADLRRALQASSIRMPVLLETLQRTYAGEGLAGLAGRLCAIEERWQREAAEGVSGSSAPGPTGGIEETSLGQLDLLLQEIRGELHD
ncbi:conserved hypothetical protein [Cyanobium sp. PCC 7001]|uniref:hypothetical protein n=1 Tax=Cyanobium sp. PCC 7001 TaxID=180281 RepID=UPI000180501B|nr:hypothetical protein [Cyanobium sp. PCC 7001]EDY37631.1 conserved hypothetical protein [Cyanobium sp. PCC 7001]